MQCVSVVRRHSATNKCVEVPPPHGLICRRGLHRVWKEYHISWIENCVVRYTQAARFAVSALGQKRTFKRPRLMSALPPKADIAVSDWHVRFVPEADICRLDFAPIGEPTNEGF